MRRSVSTRRVGYAGVACLLAAAAAIWLLGPVPGAGAATLHVAPGGSGSECSSAAPCGSFDVAYRTAAPGDTVEIAPGAYGGQSVDKDPGKPLGSQPVTFRAIGTVTLSGFTTRANDVRYVGLQVPDSQATVRAGRNVTLQGFRAEKPYIWGPQSSSASGDTVANVTIEGGSFGPHVSCGGGFQITRDGPPRDITVEGATFHDFSVPAECPDAHLDCLHSFGGIQGLAIVGNRFYRCEHFGVLVNGASDVRVENNFLDGGIYGFKLRGDVDPSVEVFDGIVIRHNSGDHISLGSDGSNTLRDVVVAGNATVERVNCRSGVAYRDNIAESGSPCGGGDLANVGSLGFADPAVGDFHLVSGSPAIDRLDAGPARDYDGQPRPQGDGFDVGADELARETAVAPPPPPPPPPPGSGPTAPVGDDGAGSPRRKRRAVRRLRVSRRGLVRLRLHCRPGLAAAGARRCRGVVVLRLRNPRRGRRRALARGRFSMRRGRATRVRARLRRRGRTIVWRRVRVPATLAIRVAGRGVVKRRRVLLLRPRRPWLRPVARRRLARAGAPAPSARG